VATVTSKTPSPVAEIKPEKLPITRPSFDASEVAMVEQCLQSGWVTQGPLTVRFEQLFAQRHAVKHALATTSCTAALHLATSALELGAGDEVIVPAFTWVTSAHAAEYVGAKAVFADVDLKTFNFDIHALAAAITPRTRAIVVVHLFGLAAPMDEIMALARRHKLRVIEDAACAVGTTYKGQPIGGIGDYGCFSFHPRKVITTGEGGMVTTNDPELNYKISCLRNHGAMGHRGQPAAPAKPYSMGQFEVLGYNLRLSDIQAAVGVAQMAKLDDLLAERKRLALGYLDLLHDCGDLALPRASEPSGHTYQSFVVRLLEGGNPRRNRVMDHLDAQGIQTRPGTHAVHRLGYYAKKYDLQAEQFPNACTAEDTTITLPIFPGMSEAQQERVVAELLIGLGQSR